MAAVAGAVDVAVDAVADAVADVVAADADGVGVAAACLGAVAVRGAKTSLFVYVTYMDYIAGLTRFGPANF